jgi:hypothetical protein
MGRRSGAESGGQPASPGRSPRAAKYLYFLPLGLALLAGAVALSRNVTNRDGSADKSGKSPGAADESAGPRISGRLLFGTRTSDLKGKSARFEGTAVGAPGDDPRRYIAGSPQSPQRAIWQFDELPESLTSPEGDVVSARFTCALHPLHDAPDIAVVTIRAVTHNCPLTPPGQGEGEWRWADQRGLRKYREAVKEYRARGIDLTHAQPGTAGWAAVNELAERFGYYATQLPGVIDLAPTNVNLPAGLFRNALKHEPDSSRAPLSIYVKCETSGYLVGVAEPDFYLEVPSATR